jgi:hypothetical protein
MPEYRTSIGSAGHFIKAVPLECADDAEPRSRQSSFEDYDIER